jgi:hypothetical protein
MKEVCPKCSSIFIVWDKSLGCYRCLENDCRYTWDYLEGPSTYDEVKNGFLKVSLPPTDTLPAGCNGK